MQRTVTTLSIVCALAATAVPQVNLGGTVVPRDHIIVYLFAGHSNMCSSGPDRYTTVHERTWNYRIDDGNPRWEHAVDPVHVAACWGGSNGGPSTQFLAAMQDAYPGYHFGVLQNADKAASVSRTSSCTNQRYGAGGTLTAELINAARQIKDQVTIGGIFINLGVMEREWTPDRDQFAANISAMVDEIRSQVGLPNLPLLMQQYEMGASGSYAPTSTGAKAVIAQIGSIPGLVSHSAVVGTNWSTQSGMMQDDHHFSKKGHGRLATELRSTIQDAGLDFWAGPPDTEAPSAPANLQASAQGTTVSISWNASTDNGGSIAQYVAYSGSSEVARYAGSATSGSVTGLGPNTTYTLTLKAVDGSGNVSGASNSASVTTGEGVTAPLPLHVNCGGSAGGTWLGDQAWDGVWGYTNRQNAVTESNAIAGTDEDHMYNSVAHESFTYKIAVLPGTYQVTLHFCEHWRDAAGQRVFSVKLNGNAAPVDPIDILAHVSPLTAYDVVAPVTISGGVIEIQSVASVGGPILNGITVVDVGQIPVATPVITPGGGTVSEAQTAVTIACATPGATVYYTTDGSDPTTSSAPLSPGSSFQLYLDYNQSATVKALGHMSGMAASPVVSAEFTRPMTSPPVALLSPNGDHDFRVGDTMHITWEADTAVLPQATVAVSFNAGEDWQSINGESILPTDPLYGDFPWVIPASFAGMSTVSGDVLVRVQNYTPTDVSTDVSDASFSILSSDMTVAGTGRRRCPTEAVWVRGGRSGLTVTVDGASRRTVRVVRLDGTHVVRWDHHGSSATYRINTHAVGAGVCIVQTTNAQGERTCHTARLQ